MHTNTYPHSHRSMSTSQPTGTGPLRRALQTAVSNWRRRKMVAALAAMDDRLLRDIGIERGDIRRVVDQLDERELRMSAVAKHPAQGATDLAWQHAGGLHSAY